MELRKDYILDKWVIISEGRGARPLDFNDLGEIKKKDCVFCAGNEDKTPKPVEEVLKDSKWKFRVIPNKFSAVDPEGNSKIETHNKFYTFSGGRGRHEVVIETREHGKNFGDIEVNDMVELFKLYNNRVRDMLKDENIKYVCLFKNQGKNAGASINHPHSQIISVALNPPYVSERIEAVKKFQNCPYCDIIKSEKDSHRRAYENDTFVSFCPYASLFNYELWVLPKEHKLTFDDFSDKELYDLASMLKTAVLKLEKQGIDYDIDYYYSPKGENLHFFIAIKPRIAIWAGFEVGYGIVINTVSPENAAKFYRGEL